MQFAFKEHIPYLITVIIFIIILTIFSMRKKMKNLRKFSDFDALKYIAPNLSFKRQTMKEVLKILALILVALSIAAPQWGKEEVKEKIQSAEIFVALDVSKSMLAEDYQPNRLDYSKKIFEKLAESLAGNKVGVIAFAGGAYLECPMTTDTEAIKMFIEYVDYNAIPIQGTDIGSAVKLAAKSFSKNKSTKYLIILSDGENLSGDAIQEARKAKEQNIKIYTIGIGSVEGTVLKIDGSVKTDSSGSPIISKLDQAALKQIASIGEGVYIPPENSTEGIKIITDSIKLSNQNQFLEEKNIKLIHRFQLPLLAAFILLSTEMIIGDRRKYK